MMQYITSEGEGMTVYTFVFWENKMYFINIPQLVYNHFILYLGVITKWKLF